jgi:hypothetical protein
MEGTVMKRLTVLISLVAMFSLAFAAPVLAAAPGNDAYAGRIAVGALPYSNSQDTTEATTDADDVEANAQCGAPATDASVWYALAAAADSWIIVDVSASDYSAGVIVVSGSPGSFVVEVCGQGMVGFVAASGVTYGILVFDDQLDGAGTGGALQISIDAAPPPPTVDIIAVNPIGQFNKLTGSATISGTLSCTGDAQDMQVAVSLTQSVGRFTVTGFGSLFFDAPVCDGTAQPWSVDVFGFNGTFKGGHAASVTWAAACDLGNCGFDSEEQIIKLR